MINTTSITPPRSDFERSDFERLIIQKGRRVLFSKALQCPCKSKSTNQQSNCRNCGGSGWLFINPRETRMIVTGVSITTDYKPWSEESRGMVNVTCSDSEQLAFMDQITLLDANSVFQEVLFFRKGNDDNWFAFTAYPVKQILYAGLFKNTSESLLRLRDSEITVISRNVVKLDNSFIPDGTVDDQLSVTVRYYHAPVYYVTELKRETLQSFKYEFGQEVQQNLPIAGLARRAHYVLNPITYSGEQLLDNNYPEQCSTTLPCEDISTQISHQCGCSISSVWYTLEGVPSNDLGVDRDMYVNILNNDYYQKLNGLWVLRGTFGGEESDPIFEEWLATNPIPVIPTNVSEFTNDAGYLTSESDPVFTSWLTTTANVNNWNTAFSWGNHASAGYVKQGDIDASIALVSLEAVRAVDNKLLGNIDANSYQIDNLLNATAPQQAATLNQVEDAVTQANTYTDYRVQSNIKIVGDWDAGSGSMPLADESNTTPFTLQFGAGIKQGYAFRVGYNQPGQVGAYFYEDGDVVYALIDNPGPTPDDWGDLDYNLQQATESVRGTAKIVTAAIIGDENTLDDEAQVTAKKLWLNFWQRVLQLGWTWAAKQVFSLAPRFSSVTAGHFLKVDSNKDLTSVEKIQPADVATDANNRFVTDAQLAAISPLLNRRKRIYFFEDFLGYNTNFLTGGAGILSTSMFFIVKGTNGNFSKVGNSVLRYRSSSNTNQNNQVGIGNFEMGLGAISLEYYFYLPPENRGYDFYCGLSNTSVSIISSTSCIGLNYNRGTDTATVYTRDLSGTESTVIPFTLNVWQKFRIEVNATFTEVKFYINSVLVATHTDFIPSSGILQSITLGQNQLASSFTVIGFDIDYIEFDYDLTTSR